MRLFDLHCDTLFSCEAQKKDLLRNDLYLDWERGAQYSPWTQVMAVWVPPELRGRRAVNHFDRCRDYLDAQLKNHPDAARLCFDIREMENNPTPCSVLLAVEGGAALGGTLQGLRHLYERGVRMLTLTWNGSNELADGALVPQGGGLTRFGQQVLRDCGQLGITVDVSHLNERGFWDVAVLSQKPFVATHSNAKAVCPHPRNLSDDQFSVIRDLGGIVGLNLYPMFLNGTADAGFEDVECHLEHFLALGGEKVVALGTDFDGADLSPCMAGIEHLRALRDYLSGKGYTDRLLDDIFYKNAHDFFAKALTNP